MQVVDLDVFLSVPVVIAPGECIGQYQMRREIASGGQLESEAARRVCAGLLVIMLKEVDRSSGSQIEKAERRTLPEICLLYTSDAADE